MLRLLYRFYDPAKGRILIDGQDLRSVTFSSLRATIGVVPQETTLFNDSIYFNILYGNPGATREQVIEAAKLARIHETIEAMPQGYESKVGERGLKLSGGERQRLSIARMLLKNPSIVFCDEATSSLDSGTEHALLQNLREVTTGRTTIVIAHRLSTIVEADLILVLEGGQVVEQGTHAELMSRSPQSKYSRMWALQQASPPTVTIAATAGADAAASGTKEAAVPESATAGEEPAKPSLSAPVNDTAQPAIEGTQIAPPANTPPSA